jgi:glutamyl-tRNA synthetase
LKETVLIIASTHYPLAELADPMSEVRTRFAPSPTGYMHIGGMRTALFNWLWARHTGGKFILRIDDTDRQRNLDEALKPILAAFRWLGLNWDEGAEIGGPYAPYFQSERTAIYKAAADRLLAEKKAYRDFEKTEVVQREREAAEREKRPFVSSRRSLELGDAEIEKLVAGGTPCVVRFLVPRGQTVALDDVVRGHVEWDTSLMVDPVIMRPDGTPLYNFATAIDDAGMQITHVIRAEEHLSNTPIQILLHQALGNTLPVFAHIPFVTAPGTTKKLSKREIKKYRENPKFRKMFDAADHIFPQIGLGSSETLNPVMVEYYEKIGFLPEGVLNALARLGWSLDDRTEFMSLATVVENFTLDRIVKNPAGLDPDKLYSFQTHWMNELPIEKKVEGCLPYLARAQLIAEPIDEAQRDYVRRVIVALGERVKVFSDILDARDFFVADELLDYDEAAFKKRLAVDGAAERLGRFREVLAHAEPFEPAVLEEALHKFVESEGIKIGDVIHAIRVAVTGKSIGPGLFDCLALLGRSRCLARIDRALARVVEEKASR